MRYAFLSDVHGKVERLRLALEDARRRAVGRILFLGDIGDAASYALLQEAGAGGVFGNWEVSKWDSFEPPARAYVLTLAGLLEEDGFVAAHAVPYLPAGPRTPAELRRYMTMHKLHWRQLFPYLSDDEAAVWQALAELGSRRRPLFFHGHTHRQSGWRLDAAGRLHRLRGPLFSVADVAAGARYLIGVGSAGMPDDGPGIAYTLYDHGAQVVEWMRLEEG